MKKLSSDQIKEIINLYQSGISPLQIGNKIGIANNSVTRILRKQGIERNQAFSRIDKNQTKQIIDDYLSGISSEHIALKMKINGSTVCRVLKKNGVVIRSATQNKRKYKIAEDYFEVIDAEDKAYFLGFLYADGNLSKRGNAIKIELQSRDRDILALFSTKIYGFEKISKDIRENETYLYTAIYCQKMHQDLIKLGCLPNKTFIIKFPDFLSDELLRHFIRGYLDGDGCICLTDENRPRIDFTSNKEFIKGLQNYLCLKLNLQKNKLNQRHSNTETRSIQFSGFNQVNLILNYLYNNATVYMLRKYKSFQHFIQLQNIKNNV